MPVVYSWRLSKHDTGTSCTGDMQAGVIGMNSLILIPRLAPGLGAHSAVILVKCA